MKKKLLIIIIILLTIIFSCFYLFKNKNLKNNSLIEQPIHSLLNDFFEIDYGNKPLNYSNVINNSQLIDMLTLNYNRFKDNNIKNKSFNIKINTINKVKKNDYVVEFEVIQGENNDIKTEYTSLIQKENEKYYINRLVNNILIQDSTPKKFITDDNLYNEYVKNFIKSINKKD